MLKPLVLAITLVLVAPLPALAQATAPTSSKQASAKSVPAWVARSNEYAQILLQAQAPFQPEQTSFFGIPGYDDQVADLGPDNGKRFRAATATARAQLQTKLELERNANIRQDLEILIKAADEAIESSELNERLTLPWVDTPQLVFQGLQGLLSDQTPPARRAQALKRLQRYAGLVEGDAKGGMPIATLARQRYEERASEAGLLKPTRIAVEQSLENSPTYVKGLRELFAKYQVADATPALDAIERQLADYNAWSRAIVLPNTRTNYQLPAELYALQLKQVGIDIDPRLLIERAQVGYMETRAAMQQLAPLVAKDKGLKASDYREVIAALKKTQFTTAQIEPHYRGKVMPELDRLITLHDVVALPQRPMQMRLASAAESAAQPAPHFRPAPLVGNTGQQGTFVLPLGNPNAGADGVYDDFNFPSVAWTLTAHEGRPGHELQFTAMVERGVSLARTLFAFNSVNVEGWALYAEAEMIPYEPLDGQLFALQFRLIRAARAMLNLGLTDRDTATRVLTEEVGLSKAMARQEVDRYTVNSPGQAGSYFYGYSRILQLRAETELALGDKFDRRAFNDFLLDQGLLPPDLLAKAVRTEFVPTQKAKR